MTVLILVKHSHVTIDTQLTASNWQLSDIGRQRCVLLADRLAAYAPRRLITSQEPKAAATGQLVATHLGLPCASAPDLHEHDRRGVPFYGPDEWHAIMQRFFAQPHVLVFGHETANQALARFEAAVQHVLARYADDPLVIVTHGTVLALFVAQHTGVDGYRLWRQLDLPSFVVFDWPTGEIKEIVESVASAATPAPAVDQRTA